jgi:photosystem II stability/assembly factor-like uncharacterized protein
MRKILHTVLWLSFVFILASPSWAEWEPLGPYGGHALRILLDSANPQRLFVFTKNGQCYRSENGGESWQFLPLFLPQGAAVNAAVLDPSNSEIVYMGVADQFLQGGSTFEGVYKSVDGGQHWTQLPQTSQWAVLSLAISRDRPQDLAAGTRSGVFRSKNGGKDWKRLSPVDHPELKNVVSLALDPLDPQVLYAGTPHLPWRTLDNGTQWTSITEGMIDDSDIFSIAIDREKVHMVYASACSGIYRSIIRGTRWIKVQGIPGSNRRTHILLQDPLDPNILYAGTTQGLWKSVDRGVTWDKPNSYPYSINSIVVNPLDNNVLYMATDSSGILKSVDGGKTFEAMNQGFVNRNLTRFLPESRFYVSSAYDGDFGGVFCSQDEGRSWVLTANHASLMGKNIISLAVSPENSGLLVAGTYEGLMRSKDGGTTWEFLRGSDSGWNQATARLVPERKRTGYSGRKLLETTMNRPSVRFNDLTFSRSTPGLLYAASSAGLFKSPDGGDSWTRIPVLGTRDISRTVLHPTDPRWMMIQVSGELLISANQGKQWLTATFNTPDIQIYSFAFAFGTGGKLWAGTSYGLFLSSDGGRTWNRKKGGLPFIPIHNIYVFPPNRSQIFVQSNGSNQIYQSEDGGETWKRFDTSGLEGVSVRDFSATWDGGPDLWVLTENRGIFRYRLQPQVASH